MSRSGGLVRGSGGVDAPAPLAGLAGGVLRHGLAVLTVGVGVLRAVLGVPQLGAGPRAGVAGRLGARAELLPLHAVGAKLSARFDAAVGHGRPTAMRRSSSSRADACSPSVAGRRAATAAARAASPAAPRA